MSKELDEKKVQLENLQAEVFKLEVKERAEQGYPEAKKLEGTFWKFRNSYGGARGESDRWWLYRYVKKVLSSGNLLTVEFEVDRYGDVQIYAEKSVQWNTSLGVSERLGEPSNAEEWDEALNSVRSVVSKLDAIVE